MPPFVGGLIEHFSQALDPGMGPERIPLHTDAQCRRNTSTPQEDEDGQSARQTVQPPTIVVAGSRAHAFEDRADGAPLLSQGSDIDPALSPAVNQQKHAGKTERPESDIQNHENQY